MELLGLFITAVLCLVCGVPIYMLVALAFIHEGESRREWDKVEYLKDGTIRRAEKRRKDFWS